MNQNKSYKQGQKNKEKENKTLNQWLALNKILKTSKVIGLSQSIAMILLSLLCLRLYFSHPIVVVIDSASKDKQFLSGERKAITLSKEDIKRFIERYIQLRYNWKDFNDKAILHNIRPFVTEGFYKKLSKQLKKEDNRSIKGKKVRQVIADIDVVVGEKSIVASFYKLLIIEKIPLPVFSQISFQLRRSTATKANGLGIYVNAIIKHESKGVQIKGTQVKGK